MYGADKVLLEALAAMPPEFDVEVWLPTDTEYPRHELSSALAERGIPVRFLPLAILRRAYMRPSGLPGLAWRFIRSAAALLRARPDLLYVNTAASAAFAPVGRLLGARVVLHLHEHVAGGTRVVLPFVGAAHRVIAVSTAVVQPLSPRTRAKTVVVHNGFELPKPTPLPPFDRGIRVLIASRWNAWKGHDVLLEAWGRTQRRDLHLTVLGAPPPSGEAIDVARLAASSPAGDRIDVVGQTDDIRRYLDATHVVVVPSTQPDPLPTIAIEALAAGRYVIGSDLGGLPEILGGVGALTTPGAPEAWAAVLDGLSEARIRDGAAEARERFDAEFSRQRFAARIAEELWGAVT